MTGADSAQPAASVSDAHTPPAAHGSIVSLIASATEIVCALGLRDRLVGISNECDFPEDVRGLPVCSEPRIDTEQACSTLAHKLVRVCSLTPHTLDDICGDFERVGAAAGVAERGRALASAFRQRLEALRGAVAVVPRPNVACLEWLDPPMLAGGWMPELVRIAGGNPVLVTSPERFRTVGWQEIEAADPDVVVIMPCGYPIPRTLEELGDGRIGSPVRRLHATRAGRTFVADGNAYFNRPGPRIADSAEILAKLLDPDRFPHRGVGAERWP